MSEKTFVYRGDGWFFITLSLYYILSISGSWFYIMGGYESLFHIIWITVIYIEFIISCPYFKPHIVWFSAERWHEVLLADVYESLRVIYIKSNFKKIIFMILVLFDR